MSRRQTPPLGLVSLLLLVAALLPSMIPGNDSQALPTTGPSPYLVAPAPPTGTSSAGDLSSSQPYWRDPNQAGVPPSPAADSSGPRQGPRQGVGPGVGGGNGTDPSASPALSPSNGTSPTNGTAAPSSGGFNDSALTRGAQLVLPAAARPSVDPFGAAALGVAGALLPPLLAAKAAEVANAAAAKVFAKKQKKKKLSKSCPLSPADRDLLRTATAAALGAGANSLAGSATALELGRCALTLKATKPAAFQWVVLSGGRVNPCSILLGDVSSAITQGIVEGKCYTLPETTAATSAAVVGGGS